MVVRKMFLDRDTLLKAGWTDRLIEEFLGPPGPATGCWTKGKVDAAAVLAGVPRLQFVGRSVLRRERGWSEELIEALLGECDYEGDNPHHLSGPPMRLFVARRVRRAERSAKFRIYDCRQFEPDIDSRYKTADVRGLAQAGQAALLADALEDLGYGDRDLLAHLRAEVRHGRCPVVSALRKG